LIQERVQVVLDSFLFFYLIKQISMSEAIYISEEGLEKLKNDLAKLKTVDRPSISKQIAEARDKGDLSENAEYDAAKEAQGLLELKISKLEDQVANARIIDESKIDTERVQILNKVKILNRINNSTLEYMLVSDSESDLKARKISVNSPIAKGLLGKKVGEIAKVTVPAGEVEFEILEISR